MAGKVVEIFGVVDQGGGGGSADSPCYRYVQFSKWREVGGEICDTPLFVKEACKEGEIRSWMKSINAGCMLHMEIRFTKQVDPEQLRGNVVRNHGKSRTDKELLAAAKDKRPTKIDVPGVGAFELDRGHDCYAATVKVGKLKVIIEIQSDRPKTVVEISKQIVRVGFLQPTFLKQLGDVLERDLLPLKNLHWLDVGEKPLNGMQLRKAMKLFAIEIASNGRYECIFDDGSLFGGHDLVVRGSLKAGLKDADLHG